jgi:hypothetical protein
MVVQWQSHRYSKGLTETQSKRAVLVDGELPFIYEASGSETNFTNVYDPEPRARRIFNFQKPETLARVIRESETHENPHGVVAFNHFPTPRVTTFAQHHVGQLLQLKSLSKTTSILVLLCKWRRVQEKHAWQLLSLTDS